MIADIISIVGITVKEKEDTQLQKLDATVQEQKYEGEKAAQEKNIGLMQAQLDQAQRNVAQAKADVDRIARLPPVKEPSVWEEAEKAHRLVPNTQAPQIRKSTVALSSELTLAKADLNQNGICLMT